MIRHFHCCQHCVAPKRHIGCHATCKEYNDAKQERDRQIEQERKENVGRYQSWELRRDSIERTKRRCHDRKERS